jgi:hypothetical protein
VSERKSWEVAARALERLEDIMSGLADEPGAEDGMVL